MRSVRKRTQCPTLENREFNSFYDSTPSFFNLLQFSNPKCNNLFPHHLTQPAFLSKQRQFAPPPPPTTRPPKRGHADLQFILHLPWLDRSKSMQKTVPSRDNKRKPFLGAFKSEKLCDSAKPDGQLWKTRIEKTRQGEKARAHLIMRWPSIPRPRIIARDGRFEPWPRGQLHYFVQIPL